MRVTALEEPQNTDLSRSESLASLQTLLKWGLEYSEAWAALLYEGTMSDSVCFKRFIVNLIATRSIHYSSTTLGNHSIWKKTDIMFAHKVYLIR